ncbi:MAG TPA: hypothetical protein VJT84_09530 [Gaiellaceae bacterium]|nr:hypothetical protein [Gaiellaceae bacterium]
MSCRILLKPTAVVAPGELLYSLFGAWRWSPATPDPPFGYVRSGKAPPGPPVVYCVRAPSSIRCSTRQGYVVKTGVTVGLYWRGRIKWT